MMARCKYFGIAASFTLSIFFLYCLFALWRISSPPWADEEESSEIEATVGVSGEEEGVDPSARRKKDVIPLRKHFDMPNCSHVITEWLRRNKRHDYKSPPPTKLSEEIMERFTRNGLLSLVKKIDKTKFDRTPITWTREQIEELIEKEVDQFEEYGGQGRALFQAMESFEVNGKIGLIFGSSKEPWIEAFALQEGARKLIKTGPVNITIDDYRYVQYLSPLEMAIRHKNYSNFFDFATSFSVNSLGFGRVDALNPDGDILELQKTYCMLKDDGLLFLGIPVGKDTVIWNRGRIYGAERLGMISSAWEIVKAFHYEKEIPIDDELFEETLEEGAEKWVVLVLKKRHKSGSGF